MQRRLSPSAVAMIAAVLLSACAAGRPGAARPSPFMPADLPILHQPESELA